MNFQDLLRSRISDSSLPPGIKSRIHGEVTVASRGFIPTLNENDSISAFSNRFISLFSSVRSGSSRFYVVLKWWGQPVDQVLVPMTVPFLNVLDNSSIESISNEELALNTLPHTSINVYPVRCNPNTLKRYFSDMERLIVEIRVFHQSPFQANYHDSGSLYDSFSVSSHENEKFKSFGNNDLVAVGAVEMKSLFLDGEKYARLKLPMYTPLSIDNRTSSRRLKFNPLPDTQVGILDIHFSLKFGAEAVALGALVTPTDALATVSAETAPVVVPALVKAVDLEKAPSYAGNVDHSNPFQDTAFSRPFAVSEFPDLPQSPLVVPSSFSGPDGLTSPRLPDLPYSIPTSGGDAWLTETNFDHAYKSSIGSPVESRATSSIRQTPSSSSPRITQDPVPHRSTYRPELDKVPFKFEAEIPSVSNPNDKVLSQLQKSQSILNAINDALGVESTLFPSSSHQSGLVSSTLNGFDHSLHSSINPRFDNIAVGNGYEYTFGQPAQAPSFHEMDLLHVEPPSVRHSQSPSSRRSVPTAITDALRRVRGVDNAGSAALEGEHITESTRSSSNMEIKKSAKFDDGIAPCVCVRVSAVRLPRPAQGRLFFSASLEPVYPPVDAASGDDESQFPPTSYLNSVYDASSIQRLEEVSGPVDMDAFLSPVVASLGADAFPVDATADVTLGNPQHCEVLPIPSLQSPSVQQQLHAHLRLLPRFPVPPGGRWLLRLSLFEEQGRESQEEVSSRLQEEMDKRNFGGHTLLVENRFSADSLKTENKKDRVILLEPEDAADPDFMSRPARCLGETAVLLGAVADPVKLTPQEVLKHCHLAGNHPPPGSSVLTRCLPVCMPEDGTSLDSNKVDLIESGIDDDGTVEALLSHFGILSTSHDAVHLQEQEGDEEHGLQSETQSMRALVGSGASILRSSLKLDSAISDARPKVGSNASDYLPRKEKDRERVEMEALQAATASVAAPAADLVARLLSLSLSPPLLARALKSYLVRLAAGSPEAHARVRAAVKGVLPRLGQTLDTVHGRHINLKSKSTSRGPERMQDKPEKHRFSFLEGPVEAVVTLEVSSPAACACASPAKSVVREWAKQEETRAAIAEIAQSVSDTPTTSQTLSASESSLQTSPFVSRAVFLGQHCPDLSMEFVFAVLVPPPQTPDEVYISLVPKVPLSVSAAHMHRAGECAVVTLALPRTVADAEALWKALRDPSFLLVVESFALHAGARSLSEATLRAVNGVPFREAVVKAVDTLFSIVTSPKRLGTAGSDDVVPGMLEIMDGSISMQDIVEMNGPVDSQLLYVLALMKPQPDNSNNTESAEEHTGSSSNAEGDKLLQSKWSLNASSRATAKQFFRSHVKDLQDALASQLAVNPASEAEAETGHPDQVVGNEEAVDLLSGEASIAVVPVADHSEKIKEKVKQKDSTIQLISTERVLAARELLASASSPLMRRKNVISKITDIRADDFILGTVSESVVDALSRVLELESANEQSLSLDRSTEVPDFEGEMDISRIDCSGFDATLDNADEINESNSEIAGASLIDEKSPNTSMDFLAIPSSLNSSIDLNASILRPMISREVEELPIYDRATARQQIASFSDVVESLHDEAAGGVKALEQTLPTEVNSSISKGEFELPNTSSDIKSESIDPIVPPRREWGVRFVAPPVGSRLLSPQAHLSVSVSLPLQTKLSEYVSFQDGDELYWSFDLDMPEGWPHPPSTCSSSFTVPSEAAVPPTVTRRMERGLPALAALWNALIDPVGARTVHLRLHIHRAPLSPATQLGSSNFLSSVHSVGGSEDGLSRLRARARAGPADPRSDIVALDATVSLHALAVRLASSAHFRHDQQSHGVSFAELEPSPGVLARFELSGASFELFYLDNGQQVTSEPEPLPKAAESIPLLIPSRESDDDSMQMDLDNLFAALSENSLSPSIEDEIDWNKETKGLDDYRAGTQGSDISPMELVVDADILEVDQYREPMASQCIDVVEVNEGLGLLEESHQCDQIDEVQNQQEDSLSENLIQSDPIEAKDGSEDNFSYPLLLPTPVPIGLSPPLIDPRPRDSHGDLIFNTSEPTSSSHSLEDESKSEESIGAEVSLGVESTTDVGSERHVVQLEDLQDLDSTIDTFQFAQSPASANLVEKENSDDELDSTLQTFEEDSALYVPVAQELTDDVRTEPDSSVNSSTPTFTFLSPPKFPSSSAHCNVSFEENNSVSPILSYALGSHESSFVDPGATPFDELDLHASEMAHTLDESKSADEDLCNSQEEETVVLPQASILQSDASISPPLGLTGVDISRENEITLESKNEENEDLGVNESYASVSSSLQSPSYSLPYPHSTPIRTPSIPSTPLSTRNVKEGNVSGPSTPVSFVHFSPVRVVHSMRSASSSRAHSPAHSQAEGTLASIATHSKSDGIEGSFYSTHSHVSRVTHTPPAASATVLYATDADAVQDTLNTLASDAKAALRAHDYAALAVLQETVVCVPDPPLPVSPPAVHRMGFQTLAPKMGVEEAIDVNVPALEVSKTHVARKLLESSPQTIATPTPNPIMDQRTPATSFESKIRKDSKSHESVSKSKSKKKDKNVEEKNKLHSLLAGRTSY